MEPVGYSTLLFDLDHTLYDSDAAEAAAYTHTMGTVGLDEASAAAYFDRYVAINRELWHQVELGTIDPSEVRHRRFARFVDEVGIDADPVAMAETFVWGLGHCGEMYDGAIDVLEQLARRASLAMVTNGLSDVQRARIERFGLAEYFDAIVISSEVGMTKPRPDIFGVAFEQLGHPPKDGAVMVGDSLTSDIAGGRNYGIDTCWYNPHGNRAEPGSEPTHQVGRLDELLDLL